MYNVFMANLSKEVLIQITVILFIVFISCCYNLGNFSLGKDVEQIIVFGLSGILFCSMFYLLNMQKILWKKCVLVSIFAVVYMFILYLFSL